MWLVRPIVCLQLASTVSFMIHIECRCASSHPRKSISLHSNLIPCCSADLLSHPRPHTPALVFLIKAADLNIPAAIYFHKVPNSYASVTGEETSEIFWDDNKKPNRLWGQKKSGIVVLSWQLFTKGEAEWMPGLLQFCSDHFCFKSPCLCL